MRSHIVVRSSWAYPRCSYASATRCAILLRSVRSHYDLATCTTNTLPRRLCYFGIVALGVLVNFKCSPKVGVAFSDYRTNSSCSILMLLKNEKLHFVSSMLIALISSHSAHIEAVCLRIIMDVPRTFWHSDSNHLWFIMASWSIATWACQSLTFSWK